MSDSDLDLFARPKPAGAVTLDELVFAEVCQRDEVIRPGSVYDRAIRDRLREKGLSEEQIDKRLSIGQGPPKNEPGII